MEKKSQRIQKQRLLNTEKNGCDSSKRLFNTFFLSLSEYRTSKSNSKLKNEFSDRMNEISDWLDLDEIKNEKIVNLSNSQKQKVVIARALINNPNIIIADQPETFLDEMSKKKKIFIYLESLSKIGSTIIITSARLRY